MNSPEEIIAELGYYCASVHGCSMYPLLVDHRDSVFIQKKEQYRKYDVVLFRRKSGQLVLHRIRHIKKGKYICSGDNDRVFEIVEPDMIIGCMTEFSRNGKTYKTNGFLYWLYSRIWSFSMPTKMFLQFVLKYIVMFKTILKNKFSQV